MSGHDVAPVQPVQVPPGELLPVEVLPVVTAPVGGIAVHGGYGFTVEPVDPERLPCRVRCERCTWRTTVSGLADAAHVAELHAFAHHLADQDAARAHRADLDVRADRLARSFAPAPGGAR